LESNGVTVAVGMMTGDDFRFLRAWWEIPAEIQEGWSLYDKGNGYARFFADPVMVVRNARDFAEIGADVEKKYGSASRFIMNKKYFRKPGIIYTRITIKGFSVRFMPPGYIFSGAGLAIFSPEDNRSELIAYLNSRPVEHLLRTMTDGRQWQAGYVRNAPLPDFVHSSPGIADAAQKAAQSVIDGLSLDETTHLYAAPPEPGFAKRQLQRIERELNETLAFIDDEITHRLGLDESERLSVDSEVGTLNEWIEREELLVNRSQHWYAATYLSYLFGVVIGRWMPIDNKSKPLPRLEDLLANGLPVVPPLFASTESRLATSSILVEDLGHDNDVVEAVRNALRVIWKDETEESLGQVIESLESGIGQGHDLRSWLRTGIFDDHIKRYSKSRRKAPIYWQLSVPSCRYSVWLYYHRLNRDTFYKVLNDFVKPKTQHEQDKLDGLRQEAGGAPSRGYREKIDAQEQFVEELRTLQEEIELVAPLWKPDLNDGVLINFAPLWRLVPQHRGWQQECNSSWDGLVAGDYDWSHLAMHLWPERVVPKCRSDVSLAIAHGLEDVFWVRPELAEEDEQAELIAEADDDEQEDDKAAKKHSRKRRASPRWVRKERVTDEQAKQLIRERTSSAVKDALDKLLAAPPPAASRAKATGRGRGAPRARRSPAAMVPATGAEIDLVEQVRKAMQGNGDGVAKNGLAKATGLTTDQVGAALHKMIEAGDVETSGAGRGTHYRLLEGKR
jgi:hypothetical protein